MNIDWNHFTPWASLIGGLVLGLASSVFILFNGRILGISGILGGLLALRKGDLGWRLSFLMGLMVAPWLYVLISPDSTLQAPRIDSGLGVISLAGILVGFGTRLGSGCTSGHGVCGISRLSLRSIAATAVFMLSGFAVVYALKNLI